MSDRESNDRPADATRDKPCQDREEQLTLYACDELEGAERAAVEEHLRSCAACAAALEREQRWLEEVAGSAASELSPALLASCRTGLAEALDEIEHPGRRRGFWASLNIGRWFVIHPAWSAALLVLLGIVLGNAIPAWFTGRRTGPSIPSQPTNLVSIPGETDLQRADISGISWQPGSGSALPNVEVHLTTEKPMVVKGTVNDHEVRRLLMYVVQNERRFDSEERLDSVELLKSGSDNQDVRKALCVAARRDRNPAVRMKALEALRGFEKDEDVRQVLLDLLVHDANPGIRIEAINALRQMADAGALSSDTRAKLALEDRMENDSSTYIRLQSAAAMRQLQPRESH